MYLAGVDCIIGSHIFHCYEGCSRRSVKYEFLATTIHNNNVSMVRSVGTTTGRKVRQTNTDVLFLAYRKFMCGRCKHYVHVSKVH